MSLDNTLLTNQKLETSGAGLFSSSQQRRTFLCLLLVLLTLTLYNPVVHNGFINLDDNLYVTSNPNVQVGIHWATVKWAFTSFDQANWHPLTWLSHSLDWSLFGQNAGGHHYVSLIFHAGNAVLLFLLLETATGCVWPSLIVAAVFAVHPVNVESVAWVAERKNVLSMLFFLSAMLAYGRYARRPSIRRYGLVALLFALGLMAKPQVITLPFVLLLWDYWPLRRLGAPVDGGATPAFAPASFRWLALEKIPLLLLSAADALATMHAQRDGLAVRTFSEYSLYARLGNAPIAYARYVGHAFWPLRLSPCYSHPGDAIPGWQVAIACIFLLVSTVAVLVSRKRYLIAGWLWFLGTLVPMIGIVQVGDQAMADRYAYISFIGLFWMATWSVAEAIEEWRIPRPWVVVPVCAILFGAAILTRHLLGYWHDSEALWDYALTIDNADFMAHANRGRILVVENRPDEAIVEFSIAERLHKYPPSEILRFAGYELRHGHEEDAIERCRRVLEKTQDPQVRAVALTDVGVAHINLGDISQAKKDFETAWLIDSKSSGALIGLGLVAERTGDFGQAADYFSHAVSREPNDLGYFLLAIALEKSGRSEEAGAAYAQAQRISPNMGEVLQRAHQLLPE